MNFEKVYSLVPTDILEKHLLCLKHREKLGIHGNPHEETKDCINLPCSIGCERKRSC